MFKTRVTEILNIKHPIMQGGMQHLATPELAAAVSNAGGLGTINITIYPTSKEFRTAIRQTKALTQNPFAINISLHPHLTKGEQIIEYLSIAIDEGVKVIETSGTSPEQFVPLIKQNGLTLIHKVPAVKHAMKAEKVGADIVTIAGYEVGGHPGKDEVGSFVLANKTARSLSIPVMLAGGVADGRGLIAALALGAEGVVMGTRFVATQECWIHQHFKEWIQSASEIDTIICQRSINNMLRAAKNSAALTCIEMEKQGANLQELMTVIAGTLGKACYQKGDIDNGIFAIGQCIGLINAIPTVAELIAQIIKEAQQTLLQINQMSGAGA